MQKSLFQRRHYEAIATVLAAANDDGDASYQLVRKFEDIFIADNALFDRSRFRDAIVKARNLTYAN